MDSTSDEKRARRREYNRVYRERYREQIAAKKKSPEGRAKSRDAQRKWRNLHKDKIREANLKRYSTAARYGYFRRSQEAKAGRPRPDHCEVCGGKSRKIHFDHCHKRGIFRGWICSDCNTAIGLVNEDTNRLRQLIAYLERTKELVPPQLSLPGL